MSRKDIEIYETRQRVYLRDGYLCQYNDECLALELELAHRISKSIQNRRMIQRILREKYNIETTTKDCKKILNMDFNLVTSCREHNSYWNCGNNLIVMETLLEDNIDDISSVINISRLQK